MWAEVGAARQNQNAPWVEQVNKLLLPEQEFQPKKPKDLQTKIPSTQGARKAGVLSSEGLGRVVHVQ